MILAILLLVVLAACIFIGIKNLNKLTKRQVLFGLKFITYASISVALATLLLVGIVVAF